MASLFGKPQKQNKWFGNHLQIPNVGSPLANPAVPVGYGHTAFPQPGQPNYQPPATPEEIAEEERVERERRAREAAERLRLQGNGNDMGMGQPDQGMPGGYHDPNDPFQHLNIHASSSTGPTPYGIPVMKTLNESLLGVNDETAAAAAEAISQQFHAQGLPSMNTPHAVDKLSDSAFGYLIDVMGDQDATANAMAMDSTPGQMAEATGINTGYGSASDTSYGDSSGLAAFGGAGPAVGADGGTGPGGSLCFITTAIVEHIGEEDDGPTLTALRGFRDAHMGGKKSDQLQEYYRIAPAIVERLEAREDAHDIFLQMNEDFIQPAVADINANRLDAAHEKYVRLVRCAQLMAGLEAA